MDKRLFTTVTAAPGARGAGPEMTVSTAEVDRDGDRLLPEGAEIANFLRNPVLLWSHRHSDLPIGTVTAVDVVPKVGLRAAWRWLEGDAFADRVRNAYEQGALNAASVGFLAREKTPNEVGGYDFRRWELLEISLCPLPANPSAVRTMKTLGLLGGADGALRVRESAPPVVRVSNAVDDVRLRVHAEALLGLGLDDATPPGFLVDGRPLTRERARGLIESAVAAALPPALESAMRRGLSKTFLRLTGRVD